MNYLLKIKRLPLLLIIFLPAIILELFKPEDISLYSLLGSIWVILVYFLWIYSVGTLKKTGRRKRGIAITALLSLVIYSYCMQSQIHNHGIVILSGKFVFLCLLAMVIFGYLLYSVSDIFVSFRKFKGEKHAYFFLVFLSFWFFPIGIWLVQPKLNEYEAEADFVNKIR